MDIFLVAAVVTAVLLLAGALLARNLRYKALATFNRTYAAAALVACAFMMVCNLIAGNDVIRRIPVDIMITLIATNNLKSNLYSSEIINENDIKIAKYTAIKYLYTVIALSVISVIGIIFVLLGIPFLLPFLFLPIILFITGIITYNLYFKYVQPSDW